ncbi:FGGY family carbohydrate kinase [Aureimonas endophytica]|nr:FGGY family carbohydrate kinase [Aureimonas endophytica]
MTALCCGLDIGSTNLKAVLADASGRVRWAKAVATPRIEADGAVATSAEALLGAAETLILEGWRATGAGAPLAAVATAGVGEDGLALTPDLVPAAPALPWFDERASAEAEELAAGSAASPRLGLAVDRFRTAAKWLWLARHRTEASNKDALWVALTDYPAIAWSGRPFMSETLAARTAAYDVYRRAWDAPMLEAARAPRLPATVAAGTVLGPLRPGPLRDAGAADAETLVVAGGHDHPVAASYIRRFEPGAVIDSMGTAEVVYGESAAPARPRLDPRLAFSVPVLGGPGLACLGVLEFAATLAPYREGPHGDLVAAFLAGERPAGGASPGEAPDGAAPPVAALDRDRALAATAAAIAGLVRASADLIGAIGATGDLYTTGGWSRSDAFLRLRAEAFARPIFRFDEDELTGAGAALIAASGRAPLDPATLARPSLRRFDPPPRSEARP